MASTLAGPPISSQKISYSEIGMSLWGADTDLFMVHTSGISCNVVNLLEHASDAKCANNSSTNSTGHRHIVRGRVDGSGMVTRGPDPRAKLRIDALGSGG